MASDLKISFATAFGAGVALVVLSGCGQEEVSAPACSNDDGFLITSVSLIDGTGAEARDADVRVSDDQIVETGTVTLVQGWPALID